MINVAHFMNSLTANTYVLWKENSKDAWLVDIGGGRGLMSFLARRGLSVKGVLLTHTHFDHIYCINDLIARFPDCVVYTSERGLEGLYSDRLNFSRYHGRSLVYQGDRTKILREGDCLMLWPRCAVEVFETPGHDWSCLTYRIEDAVFSGDSYLPGIEVFARFPRSDKALAMASEDRIKALSLNHVVNPGHGEPIDGRVAA